MKQDLPNSDIGFVKVNQSAVVKLSSADSVNFGQINGKGHTELVLILSKMKMTNRIVFYKIFVETEQNYFQSKEKIYYLVPGCKSQIASIQIGQRTVANYLLSPFLLLNYGSDFSRKINIVCLVHSKTNTTLKIMKILICGLTRIW